ncbi:hypothetical protein WICMUC_005840 [Wickerhamomyces mucosus]|uniref:J domain-containing protein n=1 Tax=Wickerhamomyces mucosus TaxID=1378264 RepID=A0A9P8P319_9ASCO|nr:hypothetical protein WICMUC_005840 [Wickerhamomyces mucosus]
MNSRYSYDENNETWPVFILAILSVAVIPLTLQSIYEILFIKSKNSTTTIGSIDESNQISSNIKKFRSKNKKSKIFNKKNFILLIGWLFITSLIFKISTTEISSIPNPNNFDPYELLEIEYGTNEKDIKSHYKKLTIKYHPDKIRNKSDEEKKELEERFVLITKAYKALTDEITRENYEKYGHPDGPQQTLHGIALPKFLIEGKSSPFLLAIYIILIGLILPYFVNNWWKRTKSFTKKGIHNDSANLFVENLLNYKPSEIVKIETILKWLSQSKELKELLPSSKFTEENESNDEILEIFNKFFQKLELKHYELQIISKIPILIYGLIDISSSFRNTEITNVAIETLKHFIQRLTPSIKNELLQLPNVDVDVVDKTNIIRLSKLLKLSNDEIKSTLGIKSDDELIQTLSIAKKIPILKLIKAEFKVPGEKIVTPNSNAHISIKVLVKSPLHKGSNFVKKIPEIFLKEDESFEYLKDPFKIVNEQPILPKTYAPYFPVEKISNYIAYIIVQKDGKIADNPIFVQNLDLSNLELSQNQFENLENFKIGTFKIPFNQPTPNELGKYQFRVIIKSLDYFVPDLDFPVIMNVENPAKLEEIEYDIPDPDEDSIAGALAQLRGDKVNRIDDDYESDNDDDDESDLEDDEDFSDINTDTEDESEE